MPWYENVSIYSMMRHVVMWLSVRLASRVTPKVLMLSEKGIWEPAIVGVETKGKLRRRCRVPNKMDSDLLLSARPL